MSRRIRMNQMRRHTTNAPSNGPRRVRPSRARPAAFEPLEGRQLLAAHILGNPATYATIQAAVNAAAPGATITVDAGTYPELVTVNKPLTLRGAQAGVDARSNRRAAAAAQTIVTGMLYSDGTRSGAFRVAADDVTIDGFTVQGNTTWTGACPAGIVLAPSIAGSHVVNNVIQNNITGLYLSNNSSTKQAVIQHNLFLNNNAHSPVNNGGRGIYSDGEVSGGNLTNVLIDGNAFISNLASIGDKYQGAVALESRTANSQSYVTITNNVFDGNGKVLVFNADHVDEEYNVVTHCLDQWSCGFRFEGGVSNVTVKYNTVYDNTGPGLCADNHGFPADNSGFVVQYNNFFNNDTAYGVKYSLAVNGDAYDGTFDARYNYWGAASGPSGQGPGTGDMAWGNGHYGSSTTSWTTVPGSELILSNWLTAPAVPIESPYLGLSPADGAAIRTVDYDHGGEGIAYHDTTAGNAGNRYRTGERVDIEACTDTGGGCDVYSTAVGEWLKYAVNLAATGVYNLAFRVANGQTTAGKFHVEVDGANVTGSLSIAPTGGWQKWTTITAATSAPLAAGAHVVRLVMDAAGKSGLIGSFNWFKFTPAAATPPAAPAGLLAAALSTSQIALTWTNTAAGATGLKVQRSIDGATWTTVATPAAAANTYTDTSLAAGTTYSYRILATGAAGDSAPSNVAAATTASLATLPTYLSDLTWASATSGWGTVQKDKSIAGNSLTLNGVTYPKGIGTHASSTIAYTLGGQYNTFQSDVGIDAEVDGKGEAFVDFQVLGDGKVLYDSGVLTNGQVGHVNVSVAGVKTLTLQAMNGVAGIIDFDHADWAGAAVFGMPAAPAAPSYLAAVALDTSSIELTWTTNSANQTGFTIQRSTDGVTFATVAANVPATATTWTDAVGLSPATAYWYRVYATNATGTSAASNVATARTQPIQTVTYFSDLTATSATSGWGTVQNDKSVAGNALTLNGVTYAKGIGTHAPSTIVYDLAGKYTTFLSDNGVDDEENGKGVGSVVFQVWGDGKLLFDSGTLHNGDPTASVNVDVTGVRTLTLIATNAIPNDIDFDHADWAGARLLG